MTDQSKKIVAEFESLDWFCSVGQPIDRRQAEQVWSWKEAIRICQSRDADNVQLESQNILTQQLWSKFMERYRKWNKLVGEVKKKTDDIVRRKALASPHCPKLPKSVVFAICCDLRMIVMELEYGDLVPPRFFGERAKWYLAGHFPCGWVGDFPKGRLIVY